MNEDTNNQFIGNKTASLFNTSFVALGYINKKQKRIRPEDDPKLKIFIRFDIIPGEIKSSLMIDLAIFSVAFFVVLFFVWCNVCLRKRDRNNGIDPYDTEAMIK